MHIAYAAPKDDKPRPKQNHSNTGNQLDLRIAAYNLVCNNYSKEITAIQKYLPGWVPPYPAI